MIILKSRISGAIGKEKDKIRRDCERTHRKKVASLRKNLSSDYARAVKNLKNEYEEIIEEKDLEIQKLQKVIERNSRRYQQIRQREKYLDDLSFEIEDVVDSMVVRVQESLQPFYRTRAKVQTSKKYSDKGHDKVKSILAVSK